MKYWFLNIWISTRAEYTNTLVVNGTASIVPWNMIVYITVEDIAGNQLSFYKSMGSSPSELPD